MEASNSFVRISSVESSDSLLLSLHKDARITLFVAEPFTWAWVGIQLAEGAVAWVGGQLIGSLFKNDSTGKIIDAIRSAVAELKQFIGAGFEKAAIDECAALCGAAWRDLLDYRDIPAARRSRLDSALANGRNAMMRLTQVGRTGFGPYMHATSILAMAQQAEATEVKEPVAWLSVIRSLDEGICTVERWLSELIAEHQARRDSVGPLRWMRGDKKGNVGQPVALIPGLIRDPGDRPGDGPRESREPTTVYFFQYAGGTHFKDSDLDKVRRERDRLIAQLDAEIRALNSQLVVPARAVVDQWKEVRRMAIERSKGRVAEIAKVALRQTLGLVDR